jgi:hypothetical protein
MMNSYNDRGPASVINLSGIPGANHYPDPGSVTNNLAVPMTPLAGVDMSAREMPQSNIPVIYSLNIRF